MFCSNIRCSALAQVVQAPPRQDVPVGEVEAPLLVAQDFPGVLPDDPRTKSRRTDFGGSFGHLLLGVIIRL